MKLVRFGAPGAEKPGLIDQRGGVRDLSAHVKDITGETLGPASLEALRKLDPQSLPPAPAGVRLGPPVGRVANFIAVGLNYIDHAKETGAEIPKEPILFNKLPNCIVGPNDDVMIPRAHSSSTTKSKSPSWSAAARAMSPKARRSAILPATPSATTSRSGISRPSAGASG